MLVDAPLVVVTNETPVVATSAVPNNETPVVATSAAPANETPVAATNEMSVVPNNEMPVVPNNEAFIIVSPHVVAVASNTSNIITPHNDYEPFPPDSIVKHDGQEIVIHDGDLKLLPEGPPFFKWAIKNLLGPDMIHTEGVSVGSWAEQARLLFSLFWRAPHQVAPAMLVLDR